jgi:hypothetical protein
VARHEDGVWRLWGRKWFTSAAASQMALTLARPEGNPPGGRGLALFYLETRGTDGSLDGIRIDRLKDKLGTRKLPTAELTLEGAPAEPVAGTRDGVRAIVPMLTLTRTWNAVSAAAFMRRGLALARDYARRRIAFGGPVLEKALHADTLAGLQAEAEGAFHLVFRLAELVGRDEAGELDDDGRLLLRVLTPVAKLTTGRQVVAVASEVLEAFGGAGYVEDTGLPALLRDSQVLSIWEGTTNVLALDALRALLAADGGPDRALGILAGEVRRATAAADGGLETVAAAAGAALDGAAAWLRGAVDRGDALEAGARRFALTLGRALEAALLVEQGGWSLAHEGDGRPAAAARRLAGAGLDRRAGHDPGDARALAADEVPEAGPTVAAGSPAATWHRNR